ncbi:B12-binding domain-containing radical SAM protein [Halobacteriovorax sp. HLS]|uniref:B12-binding domain-containing radical SAM protein n=1 Tax=Halobacteriovorax sp. HLS TaxID=2234000 RepID=UPI000FDC3FEB|nr:radical SAM protein [Halobacteriovorax sp. HLS]
MKITFIKPRIGRQEDSFYIDEGRMEPLQLAVLAGMTPDEHEVTVFDDRFEEIDYDLKTDLVGITVETYTARRAYEIATEYRKRGIPVVMGGMHVTLLPEEASQYCDSIVTGDAGWIWAKVLEDFKEYKKLRKHYKSIVGAPQANEFAPDRSVYDSKKYLNVGLIQFGRGCKFACSFCAISSYFKKQQFTRDLDKVLDELKTMKQHIIFFVDDNICADFEALKELCRKLIPLKIRWVSQGSMDMSKDPELMELLVKSGCMGNVIGFETINPNNAKQLRKAPNSFRKDFNKYDKEVEIIRNFGLQTWAAFTLGYDHDTLESIMDTVDYAIDKKFCFAAFNILVPYPGTPMYKKLQEENRLLYDGKWWLHPEYRFNHCSFKPKQMTPDQLTEISFKCKERWNSWSSIFKRYFDLKTHMRNPVKSLIYWKYNPVYSSENFNKQDMYFGLFNHRKENEIIHKNQDLLLNPDLNNINELTPIFKNHNFTTEDNIDQTFEYDGPKTASI